MPNELKPCPFSHIEKDYEHELSVVKQEDKHGLARVCCRCGYRSPVMGFDKESVITAHNSLSTRPNQEDLAGAVELLKKCQPLVADNYAVCEDNECDDCDHTDCVDKQVKSFLSKRQGGGDTSFTPISNGSDYEGEI